MSAEPMEALQASVDEPRKGKIRPAMLPYTTPVHCALCAEQTHSGRSLPIAVSFGIPDCSWAHHCLLLWVVVVQMSELGGGNCTAPGSLKSLRVMPRQPEFGKGSCALSLSSLVRLCLVGLDLSPASREKPSCCKLVSELGGKAVWRTLFLEALSVPCKMLSGWLSATPGNSPRPYGIMRPGWLELLDVARSP